MQRSFSRISTGPSLFKKPYESCTVTKPNINESIIHHTPLVSVNHQSSHFDFGKEKNAFPQRSPILTSGANYSQLEETEKLIGRPIPTKSKPRRRRRFPRNNNWFCLGKKHGGRNNTF